jgi:deoxyribose-phosphate aldolase
MVSMAYPQLASYIDHTLLKADATPAQVTRLCEEALEYGFASVCVNSRFVRLAADVLAGSTAVCSVIGFPLGAASTQAKVAEANRAVLDGARELDVVMAIGSAKAGKWDEVVDDLAAVVDAAKATGAAHTVCAETADEAGVIVKVIIECCLLSDAEKAAACEAAVRADADFVKTSTGFLGGGATVEDVRLMRKVVGPNVGVKASGGIKTAADALRMIEAGATRIGTSNGVAIVRGDLPG